MTRTNVVSFLPFMVTIDVRVELALMTMNTTLCFGPFNTQESADSWSGEVHRLHKDVERREDTIADSVSDELGIPTAEFIRAYVTLPDSFQVGKDAREDGNLIPTHAPEIDARDMRIYALRAFASAVDYTLERLIQTPPLHS